MATIGLCSYCERTAQRTCLMCGRPMCPDHADDDNSDVCIVCTRGAVMAGQAWAANC